MEDMLTMEITSLAKLIKEKKLSPVELTTYVLERIQKHDDEYHSFITVREEQALNEAKYAEKNIASGLYKGPLHGIPISIKDNIAVKNTRLTNGSIVNADYISPQDASLVGQLRSRGAIIMGKTNMDEFANNIIGINKHYGTIKHPMKENYTVGGSSGGSAVSVAKNFVYASIGTDTAGSVRIPASCTGLYGLKPTYNLIPTEGITPLALSVDHAGILAKSNDDLSTMFHSIIPGSQTDTKDTKDVIQRLKIGILRDYAEKNDEEVQQAMNEVLATLQSHGAEIKNIETPFLEKFMETHLTICSVEAYYYHQQLLEENEDLYEKANIDVFSAGKYIPQSKYIEALRTKREIENAYQRILSEVDVLITPTLPILPPTLDSYNEDWATTLSKMIKYTGPFNMGGLPAISIPYAKSEQGLPIGIQVIADKYQESLLLSISNWLMSNK